MSVLAPEARLAPWIAPYDPDAQDYDALLIPPSWPHLFGTDSLGRDIFSRVLYGARVDLVIGFFTTYVPLTYGVILGAYTVYLDLWLCGLDGTVLANGRPDRYPVRGASVAQEDWFRRARDLASGDDYVAADVMPQPLLGGAQVATFCASVITVRMNLAASLAFLSTKSIPADL